MRMALVKAEGIWPGALTASPAGHLPKLSQSEGRRVTVSTSTCPWLNKPRQVGEKGKMKAVEPEDGYREKARKRQVQVRPGVSEEDQSQQLRARLFLASCPFLGQSKAGYRPWSLIIQVSPFSC